MVEMAEEKLNPTHELVVAGGFEDLLKVWISTDRSTDHLSSNHEEADTRLILHAADASQQGYERCVLQCRDTDVLVLAVAHRDSLPSETWFSMGLKAKRPFIPIHSISLPDEQIQTLIAFHSLTGCDSVSQFADIGKKTAWKVFMQEGACLRKLGTLFHALILILDPFLSLQTLKELNHLLLCEQMKNLEKIFTYGCEAWTIGKAMKEKIQAFELWCYRRMLKIQWTDRVRNEEVLQRIHTTPKLNDIIAKRKAALFGHVARGASGTVFCNIMEGFIPGTRSCGRQRRTWTDDIKDWVNIRNYGIIKRRSSDRVWWRTMVSDLRLT
ncbi:hypothetical protein GQR58_022307 [Nymphon striatum]|nr:hypothetical protein GQR58_022307 [Nymphon striatum]